MVDVAVDTVGETLCDVLCGDAEEVVQRLRRDGVADARVVRAFLGVVVNRLDRDLLRRIPVRRVERQGITHKRRVVVDCNQLDLAVEDDIDPHLAGGLLGQNDPVVVCLQRGRCGRVNKL